MKRGDRVISHWHTLIDDYQGSGQDFYQRVENLVREREVPEVSFERVFYKQGGLMSDKREYLRVKGRGVAFDICAAPYGTSYFYSWWLVRPGPAHPVLYLLGFLLAVFFIPYILMNTVLAFLPGVLAYPFSLSLVVAGMGLLAREGKFGPEEDILVIPILGWVYERLFNPNTYFALDSALMFRESLRRAVSEAIDTGLSDQGLRILSESQKEPETLVLTG